MSKVCCCGSINGTNGSFGCPSFRPARRQRYRHSRRSRPCCLSCKDIVVVHLAVWRRGLSPRIRRRGHHHGRRQRHWAVRHEWRHLLADKGRSGAGEEGGDRRRNALLLLGRVEGRWHHAVRPCAVHRAIGIRVMLLRWMRQERRPGLLRSRHGRSEKAKGTKCRRGSFYSLASPWFRRAGSCVFEVAHTPCTDGTQGSTPDADALGERLQKAL